LAAGNGICADAAENADIALQNPKPIAHISRRIRIVLTVAPPNLGRCERAVVVAGCFKPGVQCEI
jgi:hypothetical protein